MSGNKTCKGSVFQYETSQSKVQSSQIYVYIHLFK